MTTPDNHDSRAKHVKATWGKRCNILFFVSTVENDTLPSIAFQGNESRSILWGKTKLGFQVQRPPLNRITLGQYKFDNNNRMTQLTIVFCVLLRYHGTSNI